MLPILDLSNPCSIQVLRSKSAEIYFIWKSNKYSTITECVFHNPLSNMPILPGHLTQQTADFLLQYKNPSSAEVRRTVSIGPVHQTVEHLSPNLRGGTNSVPVAILPSMAFMTILAHFLRCKGEAETCKMSCK